MPGCLVGRLTAVAGCHSVAYICEGSNDQDRVTRRCSPGGGPSPGPFPPPGPLEAGRPGAARCGSPRARAPAGPAGRREDRAGATGGPREGSGSGNRVQGTRSKSAHTDEEALLSAERDRITRITVATLRGSLLEGWAEQADRSSSLFGSQRPSRRGSSRETSISPSPPHPPVGWARSCSELARSDAVFSSSLCSSTLLACRRQSAHHHWVM